MGPPKDKSLVRCTKASTQNVVEGIKISFPICIRNESFTHLIIKGLK